VPLSLNDIASEVVLLFAESDMRAPIITGLLQPPMTSLGDPPTNTDAPAPGPAVIECNGKRIVLTAEKELVLRCGAANIILTRAGKILIRGAYLLNRSSGVNRIKGASVQIN
jgi:hypothetical protein